MSDNISASAAAAREAARENGRFGVQEHTVPEATLDLHYTEMEEGSTRVMPVAAMDCGWYTDGELILAMRVASRHDVQGIVTRVPLLPGRKAPYARYSVSLRSDLTGDAGRVFVYETGDQSFEKVTPSVIEVLADAANRANAERGVAGVMNRLIELVGEQDARDMLVTSYLAYGELEPEPTSP